MARKKILPKRIGAFKIPKAVRHFGDRVLTDPRAREMAATALLALGSALAARGAPKGSAPREAADHPGKSAKAMGEGAAEAAGKAGDVVTGIAGAVNQIVGEVIDNVRRDLMGEGAKGKHRKDPDDDRVH